MVIGITGRKENRLAVETAKKAIYFFDGKAKVITNKDFIGKGKKLAEIKCDLLLSFGGDGTLLKTFRELKREIPVMGINCGNKGFLQSFSHEKLEDFFPKILSGEYHSDERTRCLAIADGKKLPEALNEVLLVPKDAGRIIRYVLSIGKVERKEAGDGLIVATPTGSTAHSMSAGGPIVKGNAKVFVVVSINPVDWKHRPLIINDHEKIVASEFEKLSAVAVIDGQKRFPVKKKLEIKKGKSVLLAIVD